MLKPAKRPLRIVGAIGLMLFMALYIHTPSFPTPDKILVFATFVAMIFGQAKELLRRFVPFVALLLVYESFRGLATGLIVRVNYLFMPAVDKLIFAGRLPTIVLQKWWWHGHVMWYDFLFYGAYTLHFVLPFALATLVWKTRENHYWRVITAYVTVSFAGFLTFLIFPAAPPWLASDKGLIQPVAHISTSIFSALGIQDFPSVYNKISPNLVAAVPSLHAAYSVLFVLFITRLYKTKWRFLAIVYPALIWLGTVYMGEHYVIDIILGAIYAVASYYAAAYILRLIQAIYIKVLSRMRVMLQ